MWKLDTHSVCKPLSSPYFSSPLLSSSNERGALLGHPCTIMQVVYWTSSESVFFIDINVNGALLPKVCNGHLADRYEEPLGQLIGFIQYREKILLITTHAFLLQIILGGASHAFLILSKWPEGTWSYYLLPCGVISQYNVTDMPGSYPSSIYFPHAATCLPPSKKLLWKKLPGYIWQCDA